ncbi:telomere stability and silencing-domain-containing protein [Fimicolochytrium jonesii]|uniref:telomere stability and silencing-domain-containing protein n=1 Tax=Fimicolochytrium jonesii TaxID=1396493 RepID=UPI0022FEA4C7|nr:telomere stability and silencing-domain-containing protein [Fimicolochytrium jonesii]KAI8823058.1 telomere stability and silencing-domain-containing protein [Fimicolochytrium jonesii]
MPTQVVVNLFAGLQPLCLQLSDDSGAGSVNQRKQLTVEDLKNQISSVLPLHPTDQLLTTEGGRPVSDELPLFPHNDLEDGNDCAEAGRFPLVFNLLVRVPGGKGGFGSMLRAQGGKMASQKTTNFEACRDLSGRRLKTMNDAKKLADYLEKEPERKRKRQEELIQKLEKDLQEPEKRKIRFHDPDFVKNHEEVMDDIQDAVVKALKNAPVGAALKVKNVEKVTVKPAADLSQWDDLSGPEDSDDSSEEEEEDDEEVIKPAAETNTKGAKWVEVESDSSCEENKISAEQVIEKAKATV